MMMIMMMMMVMVVVVVMMVVMMVMVVAASSCSGRSESNQNCHDAQTQPFQNIQVTHLLYPYQIGVNLFLSCFRPHAWPAQVPPIPYRLAVYCTQVDIIGPLSPSLRGSPGCYRRAVARCPPRPRPRLAPPALTTTPTAPQGSDLTSR
jgi:hypothetical protein